MVGIKLRKCEVGIGHAMQDLAGSTNGLPCPCGHALPALGESLSCFRSSAMAATIAHPLPPESRHKHFDGVATDGKAETGSFAQVHCAE